MGESDQPPAPLALASLSLVPPTGAVGLDPVKNELSEFACCAGLLLVSLLEVSAGPPLPTTLLSLWGRAVPASVLVKAEVASSKLSASSWKLGWAGGNLGGSSSDEVVLRSLGPCDTTVSSVGGGRVTAVVGEVLSLRTPDSSGAMVITSFSETSGESRLPDFDLLLVAETKMMSSSSSESMDMGVRNESDLMGAGRKGMGVMSTNTTSSFSASVSSSSEIPEIGGKLQICPTIRKLV